MSDFDLQITQMDRKRHRTAVTALIDEQRRERNLSTLKFAGSLRLSAHSWAASMSRQSRFGHGSGSQSFIQRALRFPFVVNSGARRGQVAENLAFGTGEFSTPREIVAQWMDSPGHRNNILGDWQYHAVWSEQDDPEHTGIQRDAVIVVHHFGRRR